MAESNLTQQVVKELLEYDPNTGLLKWRPRPSAMPLWNKQWAGKPAFEYLTPWGYKSGRIFNRGYLAHRIIWLMVYGEWPIEIDHINHNRTDNSLKNLRNVLPHENRKNASRPKDNSSGHIGVSLSKQKRKWRARIGIGNTEINLGVFESKDDAIAARKAAEIKYNFHPNHGSPSPS